MAMSRRRQVSGRCYRQGCSASRSRFAFVSGTFLRTGLPGAELKMLIEVIELIEKGGGNGRARGSSGESGFSIEANRCAIVLAPIVQR